jgi:hypothetical protein
MNTPRSIAALRHSLTGRRSTKLLVGAAGAALIASTAMGGSLATAATHAAPRTSVVPKTDIVGSGLVTCTAATGEVGYSPASQAGGASPLTISIWFKATDCSGGQPTPKTVIGSMSFQRENGCPLLSPPALGAGTLNLAYNYPPVPNPMIDPSVAPNTTVTQSGPYWVLTGQVTAGSYPDSSPNLQIWLKPNVIGAQNCKTGITSEYIARAQAPGLVNI